MTPFPVSPQVLLTFFPLLPHAAAALAPSQALFPLPLGVKPLAAQPLAPLLNQLRLKLFIKVLPFHFSVG